jgi:hypothetical protein
MIGSFQFFVAAISHPHRSFGLDPHSTTILALHDAPNRRSAIPEAAEPVTLAQDAVARSASQDELNTLLGRGGLRFPDHLETAFREDYNRRWLRTNRVAFVAGSP